MIADHGAMARPDWTPQGVGGRHEIAPVWPFYLRGTGTSADDLVVRMRMPVIENRIGRLPQGKGFLLRPVEACFDQKSRGLCAAQNFHLAGSRHFLAEAR